MSYKTKRKYYEKETVKVTKEKGWVEIPVDFTQIYDCFNAISPNIKSATTFKLLFWLLANKMNDENGINCSINSFNDFNKYLTKKCGEECSITYVTYLRCIRELKDSGALTQVGKGHYYANPNMFWRDDKEKRETFLELEAKDPDLQSLNPSIDNHTIEEDTN